MKRAGNRHSGTLFVVGVPIGNPDDLSVRAIDTLKRGSIIAAETPLLTQALLAHHGIHATVTGYGPDRFEEKVAVLLQRLKEGQDVVLVSDSGMPAVYDPGERLVAGAQECGIPITVVPGPSALTAAIACSGYAGNRFAFEGHLPRSRPAILRFLSRLKEEKRTTVFYVERDSLAAVLETLARTLPTREVTLCIDLTLPLESILQGRPDTLRRRVKRIPLGAKVTLLLEGRKARKAGTKPVGLFQQPVSRRDGG